MEFSIMPRILDKCVSSSCPYMTQLEETIHMLGVRVSTQKDFDKS